MLQAPSFALRAILASAAVHVSVAVVMTRGSLHGTQAGAPPTELYAVEALDEPALPTPPPPDVASAEPPPPPNVPAPVWRPPATSSTPSAHASIPRGNPAAPPATGPVAGDPPAVAEAPAASASSPPRFVMVLGGSGAGGRGDVPGAAGTAGIAGGAGDASETFAENGVSSPARLRVGHTPDYPADARAEGVEGDVPLEIVVNAAGAVVEARALRRAGHGLDEAALAAVKGYRFSPAQRDGRAVRVRMRWVVQFRIG